MKETLDEFVLSYDTLSYFYLYKASQTHRSLDDSSEDKVDKEFTGLFINSDYFYEYENAISKLMRGCVSEALELLSNLVEQGVKPACYARALVLFKELVKQCDVHNDIERNVDMMRKGKDDIKKAVDLLKFCMDEMKPAGRFLMGMMRAFNVGGCFQFMKGSWKKRFLACLECSQRL